MQQQQQYYAEIPCTARVKKTGKPCQNKAYVLKDDRPYCNIHGKGGDPLPKNPHRKEDEKKRREAEKAEIKTAQLENQEMKRMGHVIVTKLPMMKKAEDHVGYLKVFPNFKHQNNPDGFGCRSLSPKAMGPIIHPQPNLPIALNLENLHQFSKCFPDDVDEKGNPSDIFFEMQRAAFLDPKPHRHKPNATGNKPLYSVWRHKDGTLEKLSYVQSRQIYCHYYEQFACHNPDFRKLQEWRAAGMNLQICGYDGYPVTESLETHYLDGSRPFGHEMVLYSMLVIENPQDYPWKKHTTLDFLVEIPELASEFAENKHVAQ